MAKSNEDQFRMEALRRREGHFFYMGGGFALAQVSFTVHVDSRPTVPNDGQIRQRLTAAGMETDQARIDAYRAVAETHVALAMAAWECCHFKVIVCVGADRHELRYTDAVRFLRAIGVLRRCVNCQVDKYIPDLQADACPDCAYRAVDLAVPRVGDLIAAVVGGS